MLFPRLIIMKVCKSLGSMEQCLKMLLLLKQKYPIFSCDSSSICGHVGLSVRRLATSFKKYSKVIRCLNWHQKVYRSVTL